MAAKRNEPADAGLAKATPVEPGDPVETPALSQMGGTFAERAKATAKQVRSGDAEDKAVTSASTKKRAASKSPKG